MTNQVVRRHNRKDSISHPVDTRFVYLKFGERIIDPRLCPIGQHTHSHWVIAEGDFLPGEPNTECKCEKTGDEEIRVVQVKVA